MIFGLRDRGGDPLRLYLQWKVDSNSPKFDALGPIG